MRPTERKDRSSQRWQEGGEERGLLPSLCSEPPGYKRAQVEAKIAVVSPLCNLDYSGEKASSLHVRERENMGAPTPTA